MIADDFERAPTSATATANAPLACARPDSMEFHARILQPGTRLGFPLYRASKPESPALLFREAGARVDEETLKELQEMRADVLHVRRRDAGACLEYVEQHLPAVMAHAKLPSRHEAEWVYAVACRAMVALFAHPTESVSYERIAAVIGALGTCIRRSPGAAWAMLASGPPGYDTPVHSVNVSILLTDAAQHLLDVDDRDLLGLVALGGALHDVGMCTVSRRILYKPQALTPAEFAQVRRHPTRGLKITHPYVGGLRVVERIISQHHEEAAGSGYPEGIAGDEIDRFARLAHLADTFDALTNRTRNGRRIDARSALALMRGEMRESFDQRLLSDFVDYIGASPFATAARPLPDGRRVVHIREYLGEDERHRIMTLGAQAPAQPSRVAYEYRLTGREEFGKPARHVKNVLGPDQRSVG
jgi:hypothetical protein